MRARRGLPLIALGAASVLCIATVEYRIRHTGDPFYRFLIWNLMLAWVPLVLALAASVCAQRRLWPLAGGLGVLWLLFFPNAPYMLTDFIHLRQTVETPLWYDALMLSSFAWTGLLLGFASLYLMQAVARRVAGSPLSWLGVVCALALASFGVYLGRFMRFNSWDALLHPRSVLHVIRTQIDNPLTEPRLAASLVVLTVSLSVGYVVLYSFAALRPELDRPPRTFTRS
jgi:uncharacterized membrane protein